MSELATNSVRHAGCGEADELSMEADVRVRSGAGAPVRHRRGFRGAHARGRRPNGSAGGYGLVLLERLSDRWGVQREGGFSVWFEVQRDRLPFGPMTAAPERDQPERRPGEPELVRKLRARQAEHKQRGRLYRSHSSPSAWRCWASGSRCSRSRARRSW